MRTAKEIRQYLRQQKWYKDYVYYTKKYIDSDKKIRGYAKRKTIMCAFYWDKTYQGVRYWDKIDITFKKWYDKGRKQ